jgi:2-polyprenyl-3-methyl-5-hydroxy-6-metoxy-1,4-benzoquinol methylase
MADQDVFKTVYRNRQSWVHHLAYMRMAKVLLALHVLRQTGVELSGRRVFDYGFGAGTFFRYCPKNTQLFGVEMDPANTREVRVMLARRGFQHVQLEPIDVEHWDTHVLLEQQYDVILCSHVLEHLPDPVSFLRRISRCLLPRGLFVGLVPINERERNPHHVQEVDEAKVRQWLGACQLEALSYIENDPWFYWVQPLYNIDADSPRRLAVNSARALSLSLGAVSTLLGPRAWMALSRLFATLTGSLPTQAAFIAKQKTS